jgi:hypothetical protein
MFFVSRKVNLHLFVTDRKRFSEDSLWSLCLNLVIKSDILFVLLYNGYGDSLPGVKRPERGVDHPPHLAPRLILSRAIPLFAPSVPSLACYGATFTFTLVFTNFQPHALLHLPNCRLRKPKATCSTAHSIPPFSALVLFRLPISYRYRCIRDWLLAFRLNIPPAQNEKINYTLYIVHTVHFHLITHFLTNKMHTFYYTIQLLSTKKN